MHLSARILAVSALCLTASSVAGSISGCGDDGGSGGAGGTGGAGTSAAASSTSSSSSGATVATSSTAVTSAGGDGGASDGGGGFGGGGSGGGGDGGAGGAASCVPEREPLPVMAQPPETLAETGLYAALPDLALAPGMESYLPQFPLWSDGAEKQRWIYLPDCPPIDTSDMDHWQFPVGTRIFKEFAIAGQRVETRVMHRFGAADTDWWFATYLWSADGTAAARVTTGVVDALGTSHDVPSEAQCGTCHNYLPERVLGFGAIQLAHDDAGLTLDALAAAGRLSVPAPVITVPGDAVAQAALGTLHANCGNCHNETGIFFLTPFHLRLSVNDATVEDTRTFQTAVGVETTSYQAVGYRIAPGVPDDSCVSVRMDTREQGQQMPPLGTEVVDDAGVAAVEAWILDLAL